MIKLLAYLLRMSKGTVALAIIFGIVGGTSGAGLLALMNTRLSGGEVAGGIVWAYAALVVTVLGTNVVSQLISTRLSQDCVFKLRMRLCREILSAPQRKLEELGSPRLLASVADDVPTITGALLTVPSLCVNVATLAVSLIYLGYLSTKFLLIMLAIIAVGSVIYQLIAVRAMRDMKIARTHQNALFKHYRAMTEGSKELKLHHNRREAFLSEVLQATAISFREHVITGNTFFAMASAWSHFLFYAYIGFLLFAPTGATNADSHTLTGYTLIVLYIMGPLTAILNLAPNLGRAKVALNQVEELGMSLAKAGSEPDHMGVLATEGFSPSLSLVDVTYSYLREGEEGNFKIGPIGLTMEPGEVVFLVGGNGAGKTTLAKLITGLYAPDSGEIRLGGEVVTDLNREHYRQQFSAVFSDFYLFESLIGLLTPSLDAQARRYLTKLKLDHKVQVVDGRLSTTSLSYGQRKRLALLTAYLEDRPFLVFDEWAAGQDPAFKKVFYTQLLPELKSSGKAVLVITHDDRYFHVADRVIKLDSDQREPIEELSLNAEVLCGLPLIDRQQAGA
ncbi:MAG TPA: cyclic peptide export ABC transporter [Blastocatellia bacterium]|nr:cyclic peptide export ABC transporter [Blastocatellia bacterium]